MNLWAKCKQTVVRNIATQMKYFLPQHNNLLNLYTIIMMVCYIVLIISTHNKLKMAKTILNNSRVYIFIL